MKRFSLITFSLSLFLVLAACDTAEERAEAHYQSALTLVEEGDYDRAIVELRNVFPLVETHQEARHLLAEILYTQKGNLRASYRQYLRIAEQFPDDLLARVRLARISFTTANWDELERHTRQAMTLAPEDPEVQMLALSLDYRAAIIADDAPARRAVVQQVLAGLAEDPNELILREMAVDNDLRELQFTDARERLDALIEDYPEEDRYWSQRLQVLVQQGDNPAIEAQLRDMVAVFPEELEYKTNLVEFYVATRDLDGAETFLRDLVAQSEEGEIGARVDLIRFLIQLRGSDAALTEINAAIASEQNTLPFIVMASAIDFENGNTEQAIIDLEAAIEGQEPSDEVNQARIALAQLHEAVGNLVASRALVDEVLSVDGTNGDALKMSANWLIEADRTDEAIAALRTALDQDSEDVGALNLMVAAYSRSGRTNLVREFLATAVEASGNAPAESARYARLLIEEERYVPAEDVLMPALRLDPNNLQLLAIAGELYLAMEDQGRTQQVIETLRRVGTEPALRAAVQVEAELLNQSQGVEDAMDYLENLANQTDADLSSRLLLLRARLSTGDSEGAVELARDIQQDQPDNPVVKLALAKALAVNGEFTPSIELVESLISEYPDQTSLYLELSALFTADQRPDEARKVITDAFRARPNDPPLMWAEASFLEKEGDIDAALAIYEDMYAMDSSAIIVANNLASLTATYKTDDESLERAWTIARRFRDVNIPAVQDTYGWIAFRRGEYEEALPYLEAAAVGLRTDPIVQFHLAEVLYALDRKEDALVQYRFALQTAGLGDTRPQIEATRARITELEELTEPVTD